MDFNPRSHEGSDPHVRALLLCRAISIHAPTRGATECINPGGASIYNFNPRSHEGSDCNYFTRCVCCVYFNPRSHEGSDSWFNQYFGWTDTFQSTLPRGERPENRCGRRGGYADFNPRSHEGSDGNRAIVCSDLSGFQSTLPRGERRGCHLPGDWISLHFNPRSHEGSDDTVGANLMPESFISIHAPTRGATIVCVPADVQPRFQSTLPRGERLLIYQYTLIQGDFNPRSHEGSDRIRQ